MFFDRNRTSLYFFNENVVQNLNSLVFKLIQVNKMFLKQSIETHITLCSKQLVARRSQPGETRTRTP